MVSLCVPIINTSSAVVRWELNSKLLTNQMEAVQSSQQQHQCASVSVWQLKGGNLDTLSE